MFEKEVSILLEKDVPDKPCHGSGDGGRFSAVLHPISRSLPLSDMTITFLVDSEDAFPPRANRVDFCLQISPCHDLPGAPRSLKQIFFCDESS
jgi:hypothetical protein